MKNKTDLIMGKNTILEVLKYKPHILEKVYVNKNFYEKRNFLLDKLIEKKVFIKYVSKKELNFLASSESHQSFVAKIKKRKFFSLREFLENKNIKKERILILDSIFDPQNMGAILRTAECFKVDGVVFSKNRSSDITCVVSKVSCGASELLNLIKVSNLAESIKRLKEEGFEIVVSDVNEKSMDVAKFSKLKKFALVVGSEDRGVRDINKKLADHFLKIPIFGKIDSLNVSQATAIMLFLSLE